MSLGLNLSVLSGMPPASTMASVQPSPSCPWGCAFPMQPIPDSVDGWRCSGCGSLVFKDTAPLALTDTVTASEPADVIETLVEILDAAARVLGGYDYGDLEIAGAMSTCVVELEDAIQIEAAVRRALGLLRSEPLDSHARAVHAIAVEAAARICEGRGRSLFHESHHVSASLESRKCATAIRRISDRDALSARPELTAPGGPS